MSECITIISAYTALSIVLHSSIDMEDRVNPNFKVIIKKKKKKKMKKKKKKKNEKKKKKKSYDNWINNIKY